MIDLGHPLPARGARGKNSGREGVAQEREECHEECQIEGGAALAPEQHDRHATETCVMSTMYILT